MKIGVNLYGGKGIFGGRETPLRAEVVHCDEYENCSLYKQGKCLEVTAPFSTGCKNGKTEVHNGYTSRARKYHSFRTQWEKDETYGKLHYPNNVRIAIAGKYIYLNLGYAYIKKDDAGNYDIKDRGFGSAESWIEKQEFDTNLLRRVCNFVPRSMMGDKIRDYWEKVIPEMLFQMRDLVPTLYNQFILENPEWDKLPDFVGKYAKISTLDKNIPLKDSKGNVFAFEGEYLVCKNCNLSFAPFGAKTAEVRIKITDDMITKITNNNQVTENTVFE